MVINSINVAAAQYKQSLVGRVFLYVFEGNMIEVAYHETEFRHLTGVATKLTAQSFYDKASVELCSKVRCFLIRGIHTIYAVVKCGTFKISVPSQTRH